MSFASVLTIVTMQVAAPPVPAIATHSRVLRLDDAIQIALKTQPAMLQARAQTEASAGRSDQSRAGLLPQVTASALYERVHGTIRPSTTTLSATPATGGAPTSTTATTSATSDLFQFGANATQLIWDFNQTWARYKAAGRVVDVSKAQERVSEMQVLLNVRRAYFTARAERALVKVGLETLANETKHFQQTSGFVAVGTRPEIDLVQEKTTMANDRVQLITAQGNYEIARAQLNQAMGVVGDTDYDVADEALPAIAGEDGPDDAMMKLALEQRPEVQALQRQTEADELTIKSIKGAYGPSLSAVGGASYSGNAIDELGPNWNVGAILAWPLFQGGITKGQLREATANLDTVHAQLDVEKLQVRFDVLQSLLTVRTAKAGIEAATDALTNARELLRLAEGRYAAGVGSIIELGDSQVALTNASAQVVSADFNLATARAQLLTALGKP